MKKLIEPRADTITGLNSCFKVESFDPVVSRVDGAKGIVCHNPVFHRQDGDRCVGIFLKQDIMSQTQSQTDIQFRVSLIDHFRLA